jgi:Leucine-rich repeat (LRR) protein
VAGCSLSNLDGVGSLPKLRELYAAYNNVSDLEPLQGWLRVLLHVCMPATC